MSKKEIARWGVAVVFVIILASLMSNSISNWAFSKSIRPHSGKSVTYYNDSAYDETLSTAINRWESTGVIDFKEVKEPRGVDLIIHDTLDNEMRRCGECDGMVDHRGYSFFDRTTDMYLFPPSNNTDTHVDVGEVNIIIHELGHFLGLPHSQTNKCSIMAEYVDECRGYREEFKNGLHIFSCGPYRYDIEKIERLYDFKSKPIAPVCFDSVSQSEYFKETSDEIRTSLLEYIGTRSFLSYLEEDKNWNKRWLYKVDQMKILKQIKRETKGLIFPEEYTAREAFRDARESIK